MIKFSSFIYKRTLLHDARVEELEIFGNASHYYSMIFIFPFFAPFAGTFPTIQLAATTLCARTRKSMFLEKVVTLRMAYDALYSRKEIL